MARRYHSRRSYNRRQGGNRKMRIVNRRYRSIVGDRF